MSTWIPSCVRHTGGMADQPCWCGACEPPGCLSCGTEDSGRFTNGSERCDDCVDTAEDIFDGRATGFVARFREREANADWTISTVYDPEDQILDIERKEPIIGIRLGTDKTRIAIADWLNRNVIRRAINLAYKAEDANRKHIDPRDDLPF